MFNNIFGWTNDKEGHNSDWSENDNEDELFHHLMQQSEDMFKNFEKLIEGFGYQDFNQLNEFPMYSSIGQHDGAQNNKDSQYKYSLRDSLLKSTQDKRDVVEKNFNHKVDMPHIFSSAFQYSDIFDSSAGNAVFEKKIRTKGPDGVEKIIISRGVGDQVEETVITKDRQGNIISQESTTNKFDKTPARSLPPPSDSTTSPHRLDLGTTFDNIRKEFEERGSILSTFLNPNPLTTPEAQEPLPTPVDGTVGGPGVGSSLFGRPKDKKAPSLYERFFPSRS